MKQIKVPVYSLDFALSNKYFELIIQCLEPKILTEKVQVLFVFILQNKASTFSFSILGSKHCMIISNIYIDQLK